MFAWKVDIANILKADIKTLRISPPVFCWHDNWRNVRIELSSSKLEAAWGRCGQPKCWATFAGNVFFERGQHYFELELLDLGRVRSSGSKKLAVGLIGISHRAAAAKSVPWQDGKHAVGQWAEPASWAFHPLSGVVNSRSLPPEGRHYSDIEVQEGDRIGTLVDMDQRTVSFFCNGQDLGVAFEEIEAESLLPAVSIRDKLRLRLCFPPPPFTKRKPRFVQLSRSSASSHSL